MNYMCWDGVPEGYILFSPLQPRTHALLLNVILILIIGVVLSAT